MRLQSIGQKTSTQKLFRSNILRCKPVKLPLHNAIRKPNPATELLEIISDFIIRVYDDSAFQRFHYINVKSMFHASRVCDLIGKIDNFKREMSGNGSISSQIKEWKLSISRTKKAIQELDTYISEDYQQFERCKEVLGKFGIEYDMSEGEYESVNGF